MPLDQISFEHMLLKQKFNNQIKQFLPFKELVGLVLPDGNADPLEGRDDLRDANLSCIKHPASSILATLAFPLDP
jgi:hypothetical protein